MPHVSLAELRAYLRRHPHYVRHYLRDLLRVWRARLRGAPVVVLTTENEGMGGYLWVRSYFQLFKEQCAAQGQPCITILIGMAYWHELVEAYDLRRGGSLDIYRPFESCLAPRWVEASFFRLFRADVFVDFSTTRLGHLVRARRKALGMGFGRMGLFYEEANNATASQVVALPSGFRHSLPVLPIGHPRRLARLQHPYAVLVERGNSMGSLDAQQLATLALALMAKGWDVFYNGDLARLAPLLPAESQQRLINGMQYPIGEYAHVVAHAAMVVTVNTLIYHMAVQLGVPTVVISSDDYLTLRPCQPRQRIIYNEALQRAIDEGREAAYHYGDHRAPLSSIPVQRIIAAMEDLSQELTGFKPLA